MKADLNGVKKKEEEKEEEKKKKKEEKKKEEEPHAERQRPADGGDTDCRVSPLELEDTSLPGLRYKTSPPQLHW
ncbi:unnamed protein product [Pleuronectes platessa]|uniref:Uncharacterized protein n=1 Tax=Pleuronectes platessa TaxID=8262 RepID=A0A9N7UI02_PLEPL|nr:unnamed protein product [Pleuronectes platessa]